MKTIHCFAKFKHTVWRAGIPCRGSNINIHIVQNPMKESLHNISLMHMPLLRCSQRQKDTIVPTRENRAIVLIFKVIFAKYLTMPTDNKPCLGRPFAFTCEYPLSRETLLTIRKIDHLKAFMKTEALIFFYPLQDQILQQKQGRALQKCCEAPDEH